MPWCAILWKAIKFRRALNRLKRAKKNAYRESLGLAPIYPIYERPFRWIGRKVKAIFLKTCCRCLDRKRGSRVSNWDKLWVNGTVQNEILKGFVGLVVGIVFTILLLHFLTAQLNFNPTIVTAICISFGVVLTIGLTISDTVRCLFILGIPQFFNKKGRAAILAYVLVLTLSGPGKNSAMNMEILTESLVCGQDMVRNSTSDLVALAKEPFSVLKTAILAIISSIQGVLERMNNELKVVIQTIYEIVNVIKYAYTMLKSIVNLCNKKLGTPYDRCISSFEGASKDCGDQLGSAFSWMCSVVDVFQNFCYFAKVVDVFCWLPSLVKQTIFEPLKEHFKIFASGFKKFFDVRLNITYEFDHDLTQDKTLKEIAGDMKAEIMGHVQWFLDYVDWIDVAVSFLMLIIVWKAFLYRYKFLNSEMYDNYYITKGMIRMDLERKRLGRDSVFPLRYRETKLYVQTFSWDMVEEERKQMKMSLFFVVLAGVQILTYVMMDYLLFLFLELIRKHGSIQFDSREALGLSATVEGDGFLAAMYQSILDGLSPVGGVLPSFDTSKCLPYAQKPNYHQYFLILFLLFLCVVVAIMEPYGLRLRHVICGWIYPDRIIPRERWLYVHILSSRDSFLVFARRFIRSKIKGDKSAFRVSFMDRLSHTLPCCRRFFRSHNKKCFLCGRAGDQDDFDNFLDCPNCQTVYCKECFNDMGNKCTACLEPIDYGDLTDVSEELGSDSDTESDPDCIQRCFSRLCGKSKSTRRKRQESKAKRKQKDGIKDSKNTTIEGNNTRSKLQLPPQIETELETKVHQSGWLSMVFGNLSSKLSGKSKSPLRSPKTKKMKISKSSQQIPKTKTKREDKNYAKTHKTFNGNKYDAVQTSSGSESEINSKLYNGSPSKKSDRKITNKPFKPEIPFQTISNSSYASQPMSKSLHQKKQHFSKKIYQQIAQDDFPNDSEKSSYKPLIKTAKANHVNHKYKKEERLKSSGFPKVKVKYFGQNTLNDQRDRSLKESLHGPSYTKNYEKRRDSKSNVKFSRQNHQLIDFNPPEVSHINDPYEDTSSAVYLEEIDGQDIDGVCYHHKQAESETLMKFDNVLSQMSLVYPEMTHSRTVCQDEQEDLCTKSPTRDKIPDEGCRNCTEPTLTPQNALLLEGSLPRPNLLSWWDRDTLKFQNEQFRQARVNVSPGIRDRVEAYNNFYGKMPYPPHCNL